MTDVKANPPEEGVNVNVILRCRPPNSQEIAERAQQVIQCNDALREVTLYQNVGGKQMSRTFRYDRVFGPDSKQERVYKTSIVPIVQEVLDGFNCTIFAYGQTGTGKTFTMEGGPRNSVDGNNLSAEAGIIPRAIKQIFDAIECDEVTDSSVKVSYMELYNEELTDLLCIDSGGDKDKRLRLLEDRGGVVVQGLEEMVVKSAAEIYQVLDRGTAKRRTAETLLNKRSSRSHSVFTITIHMKETTPEGEDVIKIGKLNLVDLAGSENISRSGAKDSRAREAGNINQSLLTLGRVITALVEHSGHVPYRDSKLTRLLRDSLGGKTKTCIIATIAPSVVCLEETISTLDYAYRAKNIRNRPELNQRISKTTMIKELTTEIERLKLDLVATREKNGIFISTERYEANELERVQLREAVLKHKAEMETIAEEHAAELAAAATAHENEVTLMARQAAELEGRLQESQQRLAAAEATIQEGRFVILSHQRAEQAIAAHATQLTSDLGDAAAELADVFGRLGCALQLTDGDRTALKGICELAGSKLSALQSSLVAAARAQGGMLQSMRAEVDEFQQRKQRELQGLTRQLGELQASISSTQQLLSDALGQQAEAAGQALSGAHASSAAAAGALAAALQATSASFAAAADALAASLQSQSSQLAAFATEQQAAAAAAHEVAAAGFARAKQGLTGIATAVRHLDSLAGSAAAAAGDRLASFADDFGASLAHKQQLLLAQVGVLLADFVADRQAAVASAVADLKQQLVEGGQQVAAEARELTAAADGCISTLQADAASSKQASHALAGALADGIQQAGRGLAATSSGLRDLGADLDKHTSSLEQQLAQQTAAMALLTSQGAAKLAADSKAAAQQLADGMQSLHGAQQSLAAAAQEHHAADEQMAGKVAAAAAAVAQELTGSAGAHASQLADVVSGIGAAASERLGQAPPQLPPGKPLDVPDVQLVGQLCCPPELVLLEHFRAQRQAVLQRGGDPVEVFGLLAPEEAQARADAGAAAAAAPDAAAAPPASEAAENEPPSPTSSVRSAVCSEAAAAAAAAAAGGGGGGGSKRSRIPTLSNITTRGGLADRTNVN